MIYQRFEDLPVWQEAARLYELADDFLENGPPRMRHSFRDQLERAVLSVSDNIAEGFECGTTNGLLQFIYIARGSAGESCSRQLRGWADSLQNSDIRGPRHLDNRIRAEEEQKRKAIAAQKRLLANLPANHPLRRHESASEI